MGLRGIVDEHVAVGELLQALVELGHVRRWGQPDCRLWEFPFRRLGTGIDHPGSVVDGLLEAGHVGRRYARVVDQHVVVVNRLQVVDEVRFGPLRTLSPGRGFN